MTYKRDPNDKLMFFAPSGFSVGITPTRQVSFDLGKPHPTLGFDPAIRFAVELSPDEARGVADLLFRKAREAEGGTSQH